MLTPSANAANERAFGKEAARVIRHLAEDRDALRARVAELEADAKRSREASETLAGVPVDELYGNKS